MPRISKKGAAGIIGTVRSPMATPGHGIVAKSPQVNMYQRGIDNATSHKSAASGGGIKTPYGKKNLV